MPFHKTAFSPHLGFYCHEVTDLKRVPGSTTFGIGSCAAVGYQTRIGSLPPPSTDVIYVKDCGEVLKRTPGVGCG